MERVRLAHSGQTLWFVADELIGLQVLVDPIYPDHITVRALGVEPLSTKTAFWHKPHILLSVIEKKLCYQILFTPPAEPSEMTGPDPVTLLWEYDNARADMVQEKRKK